MKLILEGFVKEVFPTENINDKMRKKDVLVTINSNETFESDVLVSFWGDKEKMLDKIDEGDEVEIPFGIKSREYNGKFYTSVNGFSLKKKGKKQKKEESNSHGDHEDTCADDEELPF